MKASIIILNWNGGAENCLEAVATALAQDYPDTEVLFVDNASSDGSFQAVQAHYPLLDYIQTGCNLGCPGGRNVGASHANGDILFFLENDGAWGSNQLVSDAMKLFTACADIGVVYTRVEGYHTAVTDSPIDSSASVHMREGLYLSSSFRGGAAIMRRHLFENVGKYPEDFVRQYEERYVSLLMYNAGYQVAYWPLHVLRHKGSDYPGKSSAVVKFNCINELKTIRRIYPASIWRIYFFVKAILWGWRLSKKGCINQLPSFILEASEFSGNNSNRILYKTLRLLNRIRYSCVPIPYK